MTGGEKPLSVCEAHPAGLCDIAYLLLDDVARLVTCGPDGKLCFRSAEHPSKVLQAVDNSSACTSVAVSAKGVLVGGMDNTAKLYTFPEGEFEGVATRFGLPVREVAFSTSGVTLAAGGDDEGIKLINTDDKKVVRLLRAQPYTRGLAFDPMGEYVASVNADGTLNVWSQVSGKAVLQERKACPKVDVASSARCRPAWAPDGDALAAPGTGKDILIYARDSFSAGGDDILARPQELKGGHSGDVTLVAFSKNGVYLASAGADSKVVVWDAQQRKALGSRVLAGAACGLAWHPTKNTLAIITEDGEIAIWDDVIPSNLRGPQEEHISMDLEEGKAGGLEDGPSMMGDAAVTGEGADGSDDYDREDSFIQDEEAHMPGGHTRVGGKRRRGGSSRQGGFGGSYALDLPALQDPIQPGSTQPGEAGGRRYLAYTGLGCIVLKAEEDHNTVEVSFHDTARMRRRVPLFKDFYNLSMASLGEKGALYASKSNPHSPSTVLYQPYESWAPNSDWSLGLAAGEEAECVAAGQAFCAVATSRRLLRLFSQAGLQRGVITLAGAPVALAGKGHQLAAVWHAASPTSTGDQNLAYAIYDVAEQRELASGRLPLSPGASLSWLGFSEEGLLASFDSEGELRLRSPDFGGSWVPVFSSGAERKGTESFWPFALTSKALHCIVVAAAAEPSVPTPPQRPLVSSVPLRAAVVGQDAVLAPLEADVLRHNVLLGHMAAAREESSDPQAAELELSTQQLEADKQGLKLVAKLIQADRHARALEAASQLHTMQALEGALKLANQLRARTLADRLSAFIEQRLAMEAAAAAGEQEEQYTMEEVQLQEEAVTPVPGPTFPSSAAQHQPSPSAGVDKASPLPLRQAGAERDAQGTRKLGGAQNAGPNSNAAGGSGGAGAAKRKAPSANPFARKPKTAKG